MVPPDKRRPRPDTSTWPIDLSDSSIPNIPLTGYDKIFLIRDPGPIDDISVRVILPNGDEYWFLDLDRLKNYLILICPKSTTYFEREWVLDYLWNFYRVEFLLKEMRYYRVPVEKVIAVKPDFIDYSESVIPQ